MKVIIQAVRSRNSNVEIIKKKLPNAVVYWDETLQGNYKTFIDSLSLHNETEYTLRLQDDVVIPNGFLEYLPVLESMMKEKGIHVLSLFSLKRKFLDEQFSKGITISEYPNFLMMQAVIFTREISKQLLEYSDQHLEKKHDDILIREFLRDTKQKAFVHLPNLVQHRIDIKSTLSHSASETRQSNTFDKKYIENEINRDTSNKPE
jgi:hypothetical protein